MSPEHHSSDDDAGILYPYALDSEGQVVHISKAKPGEQYICCRDGCHSPMIPRLGAIRRQHFAHKGGTPHCTPESSTHDGLVRELVRRLNEGGLAFTLDCAICAHNDLLHPKAAAAEMNLNDPARRPDVLLIGAGGEPDAAIEVILTNYPEGEKILDLSAWAKPVYLVVVRKDSEDPINEFFSSPYVSGVLMANSLCTTDESIRARARDGNIGDCSSPCREGARDRYSEIATSILTDQCRFRGWTIEQRSKGLVLASKGNRRVFLVFDSDRGGKPYVGMTLEEASEEAVTEGISLDWTFKDVDTSTLEENVGRFLNKALTRSLPAKVIPTVTTGRPLPPAGRTGYADGPRREQMPLQIPASIGADVSVQYLISKIDELQHLAFVYRSRNGVHVSPHDEAIEKVCTLISRALGGSDSTGRSRG